MKRAAAKFVSWLLSQEQKQFRTEVAQGLLDTANSDPNFLKKFITKDGFRVYAYEPETKASLPNVEENYSHRQHAFTQVTAN